MLKFFTFCSYIKYHTKSSLKYILNLLLKSLKKHIPEYEIICFTNFLKDTDLIPDSHCTLRKYYHKDMTNAYSDNHWKNLSSNKINVYKDLHDEFNVDYIWIDIDTIILEDISYISSLSNVFIEEGGGNTKRTQLVNGHKCIKYNPKLWTVMRKDYIQGNLWKLNIDLYRKLMETWKKVKNMNKRFRYDLQDLFNYYIYVENEGNLEGINILGKTLYPETVNGLAIWNKYGNNSLLNFEKRDSKIYSKVFSKQIHILSITMNCLKTAYIDPKFIKFFLE